MGTTLTDMGANSGIRLGWVLCIEGVEYLITDDPSPTVSSIGWGTSQWSSFGALPGLQIEGDFEQTIEPFKRSFDASELTFVVQPDVADTFGELIWKTAAGNQTELTARLDADDTTINVATTANFDAAGTVYIGTERIATGGKTGTTFTGCARGTLHPFATEGGDAHVYGRDHTIPTYDFDVAYRPKLTQYPRTWIGKHVGLWAHRIVGGTWDDKDAAQLIFAGTIVDIQDTASGHTAISCESITGKLAKTVLLHDQLRAKIREGVYLRFQSNYVDSFQAREIVTVQATNVTTARDADDLVTIASGGTPAGANELEQGYYTVDGEDDLLSILNDWLADEVNTDANMLGRWKFALTTTSDGGHRITLRVTFINGVTYSSTGCIFRAPPHVLDFLGFTNYSTADSGLGELKFDGSGTDTTLSIAGENPPMRVVASQAWMQNGYGWEIDVSGVQGTWFDNSDWMPQSAVEDFDISTGEQWGFIKIGDQTGIAVGRYDSSNERFTDIGWLPKYRDMFGTPQRLDRVGLTIDENGELEVRQLAIFSGKLDDIVARFFASTGTSGFNHGTYDAFPAQFGAAIPWSLLSNSFENSLTALATDSAVNQVLIIIDKPTRLSDVLIPELLLRGAYLVWKNGTLRWTKWQTPANVSVHTLTENNKASSDPNDNQLTVTRVTDRYLCNILKVEYNRDLLSGQFRSTVDFKFIGSITDHGEAQPFTIKARNSYGQFAGTGDTVEALVAELAGVLLPMFGKPIRMLRRTISFNLYENVAPGDMVAVTDLFARDPDTGQRGLTTRSGLIMAHRYRWPQGGGDMFGEVDIAFLDIDNIPVYSPSAQVDNGAASGGYTADTPQAGQSTVTFEAHEFSGSSDTVDVGNFATDDEVYIYEVDDPSGAASWTATVVSVNGGANTCVLDTNLAAFDTTGNTLYRMEARNYTDAHAQQRGKAFNADDGDLRIQDSRNPYEYGQVFTGGTFTTSPSTELPDLPSTTGGGKEFGRDDGAAVTPGLHRSLVRVVNNAIDYKHARSHALMWGVNTGAAVSGPSGASYRIAFCAPYYFGRRTNAPLDERAFAVAPMMASSTGGNTVYCRVTLSMYPPGGDSITGATFYGPRTQATFSTSSATQAIATAQSLNQIGNGGSGVGYMTVELAGEGGHVSTASLYGIAEFNQGARSNPVFNAIQHRRYALNGDIVYGALVKKIADALNWTALYSRKFVGMVSQNFANVAAGAAGTTSVWRFYMHTGFGVRRLRFRVLMAPTTTAAAVDPYMDVQVTESGGGTTTSTGFHFAGYSTSTTIVPSECSGGEIPPVTVTDNTTYEILVRAIDYARPLAICIFEEGAARISAADEVGVDAQVGVGSPLLDDQHDDWATSAVYLWQKNAAQLISWNAGKLTGPGPSNPSRANSATYRNLIDSSSTTPSAATPGFRLDLQYRNRSTPGATVPVVMAVWAQRTAGAGTVADNRVRLYDGTNEIVVSGIGNTAQWYTTTGTMAASDNVKWDPQARTAVDAGGDTIEVSAIALYQHE